MPATETHTFLFNLRCRKLKLSSIDLNCQHGKRLSVAFINSGDFGVVLDHVQLQFRLFKACQEVLQKATEGVLAKWLF